MRVLKVLLFLVVGTFLMGNTECNQQIQNAPEYIEVGTGAYNHIIETDLSGSTLEDAKNISDTASKVLSVAAVIPGVGPYVKLAVGITTGISTILGLFLVNEKKKVKVEKKKVKNWNEAAEAAMAEGDDPGVMKVAVFKDVLDTDARTEFNSSGTQRL